MNRQSSSQRFQQSNEDFERVIQFKEMQSFITKTVKACFTQCVNDFSTDRLSKDEGTCIDKCILRVQQTGQEIESLLPQIESKFQ